MTASLLGLGTAWPQHCMTQAEATRMFSEIVCEEERQSRLAQVLFRKADVQTRYTVMPHKVAYNWCQDVSGIEQAAPHTDRAVPSEVTPTVVPGQSRGPTTQERMELYARFATDLALQSSRKALEQSGISAAEITHLVLVTCTGFNAPGVDIDLIEQLGLSRSTQRIQVGFMGCHGAINGLRTALAIASADPRARVLLCAVELCSLHYRFTWDTEGIIGNALFADGSGAIVLSGAVQNGAVQSGAVQSGAVLGGAAHERASAGDDHWQLHDTGSVVIADSRDTMSWSIGDHGFDMRLTSDVGDKIEGELAGWLTDWLAERDLRMEDIDYWGVHPGGPRILSAVENSLGLSTDRLATSRAILQRHGNMSSPTVLFILNEFRQQRAQGTQSKKRQHCLLLGFGPGLVAELALLSVH